MSNNEIVTVKNIANESPTSKVIFNNLAERMRFRRETDLNRYYHKLIAQGNKVILDEYMDTFKKLEKLGIGSIVYGRKGKSNRFIWNYSLKDVATAAKDETVEMKELPEKITSSKKKPKMILKRKTKRTSSLGDGSISVTFKFSPSARKEDILALFDLAKEINVQKDTHSR